MPFESFDAVRPESNSPESAGFQRACSGLSGDTLPQTLGEFCQSVGEVRYATVYMDPATWSQVISSILRKVTVVIFCQ